MPRKANIPGIRKSQKWERAKDGNTPRVGESQQWEHPRNVEAPQGWKKIREWECNRDGNIPRVGKSQQRDRWEPNPRNGGPTAVGTPRGWKHPRMGTPQEWENPSSAPRDGSTIGMGASQGWQHCSPTHQRDVPPPLSRRRHPPGLHSRLLGDLSLSRWLLDDRDTHGLA